MDIIFDWYLWMFPLLGIFEYILISKKKIYAAEHSLPNSPLNYDIADDYRVTVGFAILVFLAMILVSGFRDRWYADTTAYVNMFESWPSRFGDIKLTGEERYPGFIYFTVFIKQFISSDFRVWLVIIAAISILCIALTYRRYTSEIVLCAFFFFASTDFQAWTMNGIRQFLVVAIMFALTPLLLKKKPSGIIVFIAVGLLLYFTHVSVIIAVPVYIMALGKPMNKKTLLVMGAIVLAIVFIGQFSELLTETLEGTNYESSTAEILSDEDDGTNILRVLFYSVPALLAIFYRKKIPENAPAIINFSINMSLVGMAFYFLSFFMSGIFLGRIPIYFTLFNYILIPWEIKTFFKKENQKFIFYGFIIVYIAFYVVQMRTWGI